MAPIVEIPRHRLPTGTVTGRITDSLTNQGIAAVEVQVLGVRPVVATMTDGSSRASTCWRILTLSAWFSVAASMTMKLDRATSVIPTAIGVGFLMIGLVFIGSLATAVPFLVIMGAMIFVQYL